MATTKEIQEIIFNVQNLEIIAKCRHEIELETEAIRKKNQQLIAGTINQAAFDRAAQRSAANIAMHRDEMNKATKANRDLGSAALTASYAFQDFTSVQGTFAQKLSSVQNNIPGLITAIAGPGYAGLAGAISIFSVGLGLAIPTITTWVDKMGLFKEAAQEAFSEVKQLEERIKELEKKEIKLGVDLLALDTAKARLDQLRRDQAAFNALASGRTTFEKEAGDQFRGEHEESGKEGAAAKEAVRAQILREMNANSPTLQGIDATKQEIGFAKNDLNNAFDAAGRRQAQTQLDQLNAKLADLQAKAPAVNKANQEAAERETGRLYQSAFDGNNKANRDVLIKRLRGAGQDRFANALAASTPEEMEAQNDVDNAGQANDDAWRGGGKVARERRLELERKIRIQDQAAADLAANRAQGNGLDDAFRIFPRGGGPGAGGGRGGAAGGGIGPMGVGPGGDPRIDDGVRMGRQAKPKGKDDQIAFNRERIKRENEAKRFRAAVRNQAKKRKNAPVGRFEAPAPPRNPAAAAAPKDAAANIQDAKQAQIEYLQMQNLMYAAQMEQFMGVWGQARQALQQIQARQNAQARQQMQDQDAFLGNAN